MRKKINKTSSRASWIKRGMKTDHDVWNVGEHRKLQNVMLDGERRRREYVQGRDVCDQRKMRPMPQVKWNHF